jgi:hypothetical protein
MVLLNRVWGFVRKEKKSLSNNAILGKQVASSMHRESISASAVHRPIKKAPGENLQRLLNGIY